MSAREQLYLSHYFASGSDIPLYNKIDKPLVVKDLSTQRYDVHYNVLLKRGKSRRFFDMPKLRFMYSYSHVINII